MKKICFGLWVLGLLIASFSVCSAQTSNTVPSGITQHKGFDTKLEDGKLYYRLEGDNDGWTLIELNDNGTAKGGVMDGCVPFPVKVAELENCIFCPLFDILYEAAKVMATAPFAHLASAFVKLVWIGFALYVAYLTLKMVGSFTKQDAPKYITEGMTMAFKVLFASLLLSHGAEVYRLGLEPLLSAGIEMGTSFMSEGENGNQCEGSISGTNETFYSGELQTKVSCFLKKVSQEIAVTQAVGSSLMCIAKHSAQSEWLGMWDLTMFFTGLVVWAFAWLLCLAFAFYLIDTIIRLGIIGALLPFLIASWPFKITSGFASKGWSMFLNAFFTFVFLGLVIDVNLQLASQAITGGNIGDAGSSGIIAKLMGNEVEAVLETLSIGLGGFVFLLICCIFGFKLCAQTAQLASEMSGARSSGIGSEIATSGAAFAKYMGKKGAKWSWGIAKGSANVVGEFPTTNKYGTVGNSLRAAGDAVTRAPSTLLRKAYNRFTPSGRRLNAANGYDGDIDDALNNMNPDNMNQSAGTPNDDLDITQNRGGRPDGGDGGPRGGGNGPHDGGTGGSGATPQTPQSGAQSGNPADDISVDQAMGADSPIDPKTAADNAKDAAVNDGKNQLDAAANNNANKAQGQNAQGGNGSGSGAENNGAPRTTPQQPAGKGFDLGGLKDDITAKGGTDTDKLTAAHSIETLAAFMKNGDLPKDYEFAIKAAIEGAAVAGGVTPQNAVAVAYVLNAAVHDASVRSGIDDSTLNSVQQQLKQQGINVDLGQSAQQSGAKPYTWMKEGKVFGKDGKLQHEVKRDTNGDLVQTNYDKDGNVTHIIRFDGKRHIGDQFDKSGNVVRHDERELVLVNGKVDIKRVHTRTAKSDVMRIYEGNGRYDSNGRIVEAYAYQTDGFFDCVGRHGQISYSPRQKLLQIVTINERGGDRIYKDIANNTIKHIRNNGQGFSVIEDRPMTKTELADAMNDIRVHQQAGSFLPNSSQDIGDVNVDVGQSQSQSDARDVSGTAQQQRSSDKGYDSDSARDGDGSNSEMQGLKDENSKLSGENRDLEYQNEQAKRDKDTKESENRQADYIAQGFQDEINRLTQELADAKKRLEENKGDSYLASEVRRKNEELTRKKDEYRKYNESNKK